MSLLRTWEKWYTLSQQVCLLCLPQNMNLRMNSQYSYNTLPQNVFQFVHNVRCFYVGDEYRSTGRNVPTNLHLADILSRFISPKFVSLLTSE